jgi:hypothetical protein
LCFLKIRTSRSRCRTALVYEPFPAFEARVRAALADGLARPTIRTAFLTAEGAKALLYWMLAGSANLLFVALTWLLWLGSRLLPARVRPRFPTESRRAIRDRRHTGSVGTASPLRADMIFGNDRPAMSRTLRQEGLARIKDDCGVLMFADVA